MAGDLATRAGWALAALLAVLLATLAWLYAFGYSAPPVNPDWEITADSGKPGGGLTVRFSGTATLLFSDGNTRWMVDGWFSRPGPLRTLFGTIRPDPQAIASGLARNAVSRLDAVIPVHSHYDHAMDAPEVARRTGALVIGSEATANIARGWGLSESQIRVVEDGEQVSLGDFRLTFIESRHFQFNDPRLVETLLTDSEISSPLVPPARVFDYKLGKAWVLHAEHPAGSFLVVGSAGFIPGQLEPLDVDVLFLGVGGIGAQTADYRRQFWRNTVDAVEPGRVILIHWDSLTAPLAGPFRGEARIADFLSGGNATTRAFLEERASAQPNIPLQTLPRFDEVQLLPAPGQ